MSRRPDPHPLSGRQAALAIAATVVVASLAGLGLAVLALWLLG